jgi:hypothetical protein
MHSPWLQRLWYNIQREDDYDTQDDIWLQTPAHVNTTSDDIHGYRIEVGRVVLNPLGI